MATFLNHYKCLVLYCLWTFSYRLCIYGMYGSKEIKMILNVTGVYLGHLGIFWQSLKIHTFLHEANFVKTFQEMGVLILAIMYCKLIVVNIGGIMKQVENFN